MNGQDKIEKVQTKSMGIWVRPDLSIFPQHPHRFHHHNLWRRSRLLIADTIFTAQLKFSFNFDIDDGRIQYLKKSVAYARQVTNELFERRGKLYLQIYIP